MEHIDVYSASETGTLDSRLDGLKTGKVKPISRDEILAPFRENSAATRRTSLTHPNLPLILPRE